MVRKAKAHQLSLAKDVKRNKDFYKYLSNKRRIKEEVRSHYGMAQEC